MQVRLIQQIFWHNFDDQFWLKSHFKIHYEALNESKWDQFLENLKA